ncbi:flavin reductase family protein [Alkaliphilus hydrothermalis]|uniref:Flavin reductase (DIM6/NTAB) family NADH-FMN oxidoreductase RutF n=1 Tax=Alkaliphilus hydrothermalis TaxID=1482730 RepID=A0ABS2NTW6_9FIRM|nr:flavin reductase family protein [Alkaliphilus hydrothermalis]MBM7616387.1 flavin reductase (DIM6/NTAB) family NADH-FMN oxidoreductase RutF [Alkaliphilus hydrothermalis]
MKKVNLKPQTMLYPVPSVMVSCNNNKGENNIITIAWVGIVSSQPPMLSIAIRPERHSFDMIKETMEFVVNLPDEKLLYENDFCGVKSGKEVNKFETLRLTAMQGEQVKSPIIQECPLNLECKVKEIVPLGSHHLFLAEIVNIQVNEEYVKEEQVDLQDCRLFTYLKGTYYGLGDVLGRAGLSVRR